MRVVSASATERGIQRIQMERAIQMNQSLPPPDRHFERIAPRPHSEQIIARVAQFHDLTVKDLVGPLRGKALVAARWHAIYEVCRIRPDLSFAAVGRIFHKDHTSILHSVEKFPDLALRHGVTVPSLPARKYDRPLPRRNRSA